MSSKGRGAESVESDFYSTPAWATYAILAHLLKSHPSVTRWTGNGPNPQRPMLILEPTAGKGAIVRVLRTVFPKAEIHACELDRGRASELTEAGADRVWVGDLAEYDAKGCKYDLILTNPPFTIAINIIELCQTHVAPGGLNVHLLRQAILASKERAPFWKRHSAEQNILPQRPSFAASLKCGEKTRCGWARIQEIAAARPDVCLGCGGKVAVTTSDSADYSWFVFGEGIKREWRILDIDRSAA